MRLQIASGAAIACVRDRPQRRRLTARLDFCVSTPRKLAVPPCGERKSGATTT